MLASTIVYFSLLSASWMSAVSAVLEEPHLEIVDTFLTKLRVGKSLAVAFHNTQQIEEALETYCRYMVNRLTGHVDDYLTPIPRNMDYDRYPPPGRGGVFDRAWKEIPYIVYWIRYSNLLILNRLKQDLIRRRHRISPRSILAVVDEEYVRDVSEKHGVNNHPPEDVDSFQTHIINIAKQFSLNKAMLNLDNSPTPLRARLGRYQLMIRDLHDGMARYMRIETRFRNHHSFIALEVRINDLNKPENRDVRGYDHDHVKFYVEIVSREILAVIAIYAGPPRPFISLRPRPNGTEVISRLLENLEVVRHFMRLDRFAYIQFGRISNDLLNVLRQGIVEIHSQYQAGHAWMSRLAGMLDVLSDVGNRIH